MPGPRRPERLEPLKAAVYALGQKNESFDVPWLTKELKYRSGADKQFLSNTLHRWFLAGYFAQLPRTGKHNLYQVKAGKLAAFKPAPPPAPVSEAPKPAPSVPGAAQAHSTPSTQPGTLDALFHQWLENRLKPYGTMLQAVVGEVGRLRKEVDNIMELLSRPEGDRPAMPEPRPVKESFNLDYREPNIPLPRPVAPPPIVIQAVEDSALAMIVSRLGPEWHVNPTACREYDELDGLTQGRAVRALRAAASMSGAWPKIGKQMSANKNVPVPYRRPGTYWAFRAGKKDRVLVRRNGTTITVEAVVKRNDHRWYGSEAGPRGK